MLATRMRQKDSEFYFVSYPAADLVPKVRFVSRYYGERGEASVGGPSRRGEADEDEQFVAAIEQGEEAFQRELNRRKVRQIRDFFRNETEQPLIPGAVLLFTDEELRFDPVGQWDRVGDLREPRGEFLVIDGQHRLAGLNFYLNEPGSDHHLEIPCIIFDGKTRDFATEMFVIINSTHTRIRRSHLIDLYEKINWGSDREKRYAAALVKLLYQEGDSPLRYHVNLLGGRSRQELWINQAQLFGEIHRLMKRDEILPHISDGRGLSTARGYGYLRDVYRAARSVFGDAWGDNKRFMVTRDVTLKALVRVAGDVVAAVGDDLDPAASNEEHLAERFAPWGELVRDFRRDGFYERFPARGQAERVDRIRRRLIDVAGLD